MNEALQVVGKILRITDVVVQINPSEWKPVILREGYMVRMSSVGRSGCFLGTT
jgi:hypothetical protein